MNNLIHNILTPLVVLVAESQTKWLRQLIPTMRLIGLRSVIFLGTLSAASRAHGQTAGTIERGDFRFAYDARGVSVQQDGKLLTLRASGNWDYPWLAEIAMTGVTTRVQLLSGKR